jgi:hypothetical protein
MWDAGLYLDRRVWLHEARDVLQIPLRDLSGSIVFLWIDASAWQPANLLAAARSLAHGGVLGIAVAGDKGDEAFDIILEATHDSTRHVMTYYWGVCEIGDAIDGFLCSVIPDKDRWDEWQSYAVCVVAAPRQSQFLVDAATAQLRSKGLTG